MRFSFALVFATGVSFASPQPLHSAETCAGVPFVNTVRPRAIEESAGAVGPQIFDVATHPRGFVLMANNYGLLTYDGVGWRLMALGRSAVAFSVAAGRDGRMFAGGSRTFGEVVEDPTGQLLYQPLESRLPSGDRGFSDIWQTLISPNGTAYFRSAEKLIVLENGDARAITPSGRFSAAGLVDNVLYAHDTGVGLVTLNGTRAEALAGGEKFQRMRVTAISSGAQGALLVGTQDRGLFRFRLDDRTSELLSKSVPELQTAEILSVRRLGDGQIAVGTLRSGLFVLDAAGILRYRMDRDSGLPDNAILTLQATGGALWAGTSGGVAQLLTPNPVQGFAGREGLPGIVEAVRQHEGSIYAATSQGVFRMTCDTRAFEPLTTLRKQSFALLANGSLLVATADGLYEVHEMTARLLRAGLARGLAKSRDPDRVWVATQTGASVLSRRNGQWVADPRLALPKDDPQSEGLEDVEATSVGEDEDGRVFVAFVTGRVISGLPAMRNGVLSLTQIRSFGAADGISSGFAEVLALKEALLIGTTTAVLKPSGDHLVPDPRFTKVLGQDKGAFRIRETEDGGYWVASAKQPLRLVRDKEGALSLRSTSLSRTPSGSRILDFLEVSPNEVWIGTDDGAFRYDPSADTVGQGSIAAHVRRVRSNEDELFSGGASDSLEDMLPHLASLRFEVSSSSLDDPSRNRFRFRLDGQDRDWSPWTAETRKDYTNLGPGAYRFRVETRDVYGNIGQEAGVSFVVATPWYRKPWAIGLGLFAVGGFFMLALHLRTRALRNRQRELESIVEQKTAELREASFTDPLTGLRNRRYFAEVISSEASLASRSGSSALHMFLVDLDHFKKVNDTHGHAAGDEILRQTAARLKTAMRTSDLLFRWGGEEFLIVARGASDLPRSEIARRIVRIIGEEPFDIGQGVSLARTCSVGFASFPFYSTNSATVPVDAVIELADLSLYRAKHTGRNRAVGVSPQVTEPVAGDVWKKRVLEELEKNSVAVEVIEGPAIPLP